MSTATKTIKATGTDLVKVSGDVTTADLYEKQPDVELSVEPLSASRAFASFIAQGGTGYGSASHGTFAGQICSVKAKYGKKKFSYGLCGAPVYNTGYPLQRIMEGPQSSLLDKEFGPASEMVLRVRKRMGRRLTHTATNAPEFSSPSEAERFFVNADCAKALGLSGAGMVTSERVDGDGDAAWSKRFVLDAIPTGHVAFMALTQPSGSKTLAETHGAASTDGLFMALGVHTGVLVVASAPKSGVEALAAKANELPLTWRIDA
jgi:hypothetical protein